MSSEKGLCGLCGVSGTIKEIQEHFLNVHTDAGTSEEMEPIEKDQEAKPEQLRWASEHMIRLVEKHYSEFNLTLKKKVWIKITSELNSICGQTFTHVQVENKWKGLKKTYKNIKDHNNKSGNDRRSWEYLNIMDTFMSERPEVIPPVTCSSANGLKINQGKFLVFGKPDKQKMIRNRSCNFTINEKTCLFTLVAKYKLILENKKTDAVTNQDKMNTWEKVAREFNSLSPGNVQRPTGVLKRFYENKKKELRKRCANIKMHIRGTGGGPPLLEDKHPTDDLLLSIINEKTVYGMNPPYGGDVDSESEDEVQNEADRLTDVLNNKIELVYDQSSKPDSSIYDMELEHVNTPELESTDSLTSTATSQENNNKTWASYTPSDLLEKVSSPLKRKISKVLSQSQEENIPGPSTIEKTPKNSSRRRPAVVVKSLTSSGIAAKYDKLPMKKKRVGAKNSTKCY